MIGFEASQTEIAAIRRGAIRATLLLRSAPVSVDRSRALRRIVRVHDEDDRLIEVRSEPVMEQRAPGEERRLLVLTVKAVELLDVFARDGDHPLTLMIARRCGYQSAGGLRSAWRAAHPRSELAKVVWFALGDVRDRPVFLTPTPMMRWGPGRASWRTRPARPTGPLSEREKQTAIRRAGVGDYTRGGRKLDAGEVPPADYVAGLAARNGQQGARRRADQAAELAQLSAAQRLERIEGAGEQLIATVRQELRIISQRAGRAGC